MQLIAMHAGGALAATAIRAWAPPPCRSLPVGPVRLPRAVSKRRIVIVASAADSDDVRLQLEKSQQALSAALDQLRVSAAPAGPPAAAVGLGSAASAGGGSLADNGSREQALWQRQEALWAREMGRWDEERAAWAAKEAAMQAQVEQLRSVVVELAAQQAALAQALARARLSSLEGGSVEVEFTQTTRSSSSSGASAIASDRSSRQAQGGYEVEGPATPRQGLFGSGSTPPPTTSTADTASSSASAPSQDGNGPSRRQQGHGGEEEGGGVPQASWAGLFDGLPGVVSSPGGVDAAATESIAQQLAAAMAAVDNADVLADDVDFLGTAAAAPGAGIGGTVEEEPAASAPPTPSASASTSTAPASTAGGQEGEAPPTLVRGDDDIVWVERLQSSLLEAGYYCGEEEMEEFFFGEQTVTALLTFQACAGLPETGVTDEDTWRMLLDTRYDEIVRSSSSSSSAVTSNAAATGPVIGATSGGFGADETRAAPQTVLVKWPVLQEGEGGRFVHALHVALQDAGYFPGEDDMEWWWFGAATGIALRTFQACAGLPESGVCDPRTWVKLLGEDATPAQLNDMWTGDKYDDDLATERKGVFLMGEQRWEDPSQVEKIREKIREKFRKQFEGKGGQ